MVASGWRCRFNPWVEKIPLEKEVATHSNTLAWEIPWTEEFAGLQPMESQRDGHSWARLHVGCLAVPVMRMPGEGRKGWAEGE